MTSLEFIESLLDLARGGQIVTPSMFEGEDLDSLMDSRDEEAFDSKWCEAFSRLEDIELAETEEQLMNELCEVLFKAVYDLTENCELPAAVSDDFELITKAWTADLDSPWVCGVSKCYQRNKFPCGTILEEGGKVRESFD